MKFQFRSFWISLLLVCLIGCANEPGPVLETAVPTQSATKTSTATQIPTSTSPPTATPTLLPSPTVTPALTNTPIPLPNVPETIFEMEDWLTTHWQEHTDPVLVRNSLVQKRWIPYYLYKTPFPNDYYINFEENGFIIDQYGLITMDIDNNGTQEWIISLLFCDEQCVGDGNLRGSLWIINENGLIYQSSGSKNEPDRATYPIAKTDLTGDGLDDLVTWADQCNISCYQEYHVISGHSGKIENIIYDFINNTMNGMGTQIRINDETGDGIDDIILRGFVYYSAGAEPQRGRTEVWSWNGNAISLYERQDHPIYYLVHALYYANEKYDEHDFMMANSWYARAIFDEDLQESVLTGGERAMVQQYAAFRLVLMYLQRNIEDDAQEWQTWLEDNFPNKPLTQAAALLISERQAHNNLSIACETVTNFLQEEEIRFQESGGCPSHRPTCGLFTPIEVVDTYGVNPELHVEDICKVNYP